MIEATNIYKSLRERLEAGFTPVKVQTKDLKNPVAPCFYIEFVAESTAIDGKEFEKSTIGFNLVYFSDEKTLLDLLQVQKKLKRILKKPLEILVKNPFDDTDLGDINLVEIDKMSFSVNEEDYVLNCSLDIEITQRIAIEPDVMPDDSDEGRYYTMEEIIL